TLKETPGLGMRITEEEFSDAFEGHALQPLALTTQGGDIDAVAGATISSSGVVQAVQRAVTVYKSLKPNLVQTWN
ncbi:MAG: FMN-binding protein, partial [Okeania sp. SIO3C4]|nr:FMN-binding protein [Okeania sp. SIO3C4]